MSKENEARTYHFSGENLPHLRGIHGLIYSPLRHKNPISSFPIYPSFNGIKVDVKEALLPDYCKSDLIHRALASLEKNPEQAALVAALRDYAKSRKQWIDVECFKEPVAAFITSVPLVCSFPMAIIAVALSLPLSTSLFIITGCLLGLLAATAVVWTIGMVLNVKMIELVGRYLNRDRFTPERQQVFEKKLEELLESPCINEEKEKSANLNTAERIAINTKRPSNHRVHFFASANEDENVTIQPLSEPALPPMPLR